MVVWSLMSETNEAARQCHMVVWSLMSETKEAAKQCHVVVWSLMSEISAYHMAMLKCLHLTEYQYCKVC